LPALSNNAENEVPDFENVEKITEKVQFIRPLVTANAGVRCPPKALSDIKVVLGWVRIISEASF
jgi:hypothetical protein